MRALANAFYAALETTTKSLSFSQDQTALSVDNLDIYLGWKARCASLSCERFDQTHQVPSLTSLSRGHHAIERPVDYKLSLDMSPKASLHFSR